MPGHKHVHARREHNHWNEFVQGVENVAKELNPFKDTTHTLAERATVIKTVYTTMSADFDGPIAGWSTVGVPANPTNNPDIEDTGVQVSVAAAAPAPAPSSEETTTRKENAQKTSTNIPESLAPTKSIDLDDDSTLALAKTTSFKQAKPTTTTTSEIDSLLSPTDAAAPSSSNSSSSSSNSSNSSSEGTSAGTKAGIAIGVLGGLFLIALLVFLLFNKRKKELAKQRAQDDEKINGPFVGGRAASVRSTRTVTAAVAPQLSLRPGSQFNPSFNERRSSKGAGLMLATAGANQQNVSRAKGGSMWERPATANSSNPENPFNNDAERAYSPTANEAPVLQNQARNPFDSPEHVVGMAQTTDMPATPVTAAATAVGVAATTSLTRKASTRKEAPEPLDLTMPAGPPSPTGTEFSMHSVAPGQSPGPSKSATAIAEAGGPASTAVHRVQLDFKPSMEDELGLQAGQLVRIIHEYDDGWALCIRLDRSKQGVVPRTCLSTRPVKPRPAGGPPGPRNGGPPVNPSGQRGPPRGPAPNHPSNYPPGAPRGRPEPPMGPMNGRPQSPAQMRPYSPAGGRMSPQTGRPASPANARPMSPGPRAQSPGPRQQRSQSPSGVNRRPGPPGPSPMNPNNGPGAPHQFRGPPGPPPQGQVGRKPVPGQAY